MKNKIDKYTLIGNIIGILLVIFSLVTAWQAGVWWVTIHLLLVWLFGMANSFAAIKYKKDIEELKARLGE